MSTTCARDRLSRWQWTTKWLLLWPPPLRRRAMDSGVARLRVAAQLVARYCSDFIYEGIMAPVPALEEAGNADGL